MDRGTWWAIYSPWRHRVRYNWSNWTQHSTRGIWLVNVSLVLQYSLKSPRSSNLECSELKVLIISLSRVVLILNISSLFQRQDFLYFPVNALTTLKIKSEFLRHFPGGSVVKKPPAMQETQETWVQFHGLGRSSGEGNGDPLQYSFFFNINLFILIGG